MGGYVVSIALIYQLTDNIVNTYWGVVGMRCPKCDSSLISEAFSFFSKKYKCNSCNHKFKAGKQESPDEFYERVRKEREKEETFMFRVVGVTKENERGKNIQSILKSVIKTYRDEGALIPFDGMTNNQLVREYNEGFGSDNIGEYESQYLYNIIELVQEPDNYYDGNAVKVYITDANKEKHHIGYVGKDDNLKLNQLIENYDLKRSHIELLGGKHKHIEYDEYDDKGYIETKDLTIGISVFLAFAK